MARHEVVSPIPGVFYRRPDPQSEPFAEPGQQIAADDTIGLIEVMKYFHQVPAGAAGTVVEFVVENEDVVDAGQVLAVVDDRRMKRAAGRQPRRDRGTDHPGRPGPRHRDRRGVQRAPTLTRCTSGSPTPPSGSARRRRARATCVIDAIVERRPGGRRGRGAPRLRLPLRAGGVRGGGRRGRADLRRTGRRGHRADGRQGAGPPGGGRRRRAHGAGQRGRGGRRRRAPRWPPPRTSATR